MNEQDREITYSENLLETLGEAYVGFTLTYFLWGGTELLWVYEGEKKSHLVKSRYIK